MAVWMFGVGNLIYREIGRASGGILRSSPIVRSVLLHRSVAAGDAAFGRSDIDLIVVVRSPVPDDFDGAELSTLSRRVRLMHRLMPVVGQMEVHDPEGLSDWMRADTYRGSQERRSAIRVAGEPVEFGKHPVRKEHALRRLLVSFHTFLPGAILCRNRRNLLKASLDVWNAYATAAGLIDEPFVSRARAGAHCESLEGRTSAFLIDPEQARRFLLATAARLHGSLFPALSRLDRVLTFRAPLPPGCRGRTVVVIPEPCADLPAAASGSAHLIFTPETLNLYVHYCNPFFYDFLPPAILELGLARPGVPAFVRACRYFGATHKLRSPVFMKTSDEREAVARVALLRHSVGRLRDGATPAPFEPRHVTQILTEPRISGDYYRSAFPRLYAEARSWSEALRTLPDSAEDPD